MNDLPISDLPVSGFASGRLARLGPLLQEATADGRLPGALLLLARGSDVQVETAGWRNAEGRVPMQRDTIVRIASMTKAILAVAALQLVEEARITLDEPVDWWLPELANRRVLRDVGAELDDTVPAHRAVTMRDLLTLRMGLGAVMAAPGSYPIQAAIDAVGLSPGPDQPPITPDDYMRRLGSLPLIHQPGEGWMYHTGYDVLAVLIARVTGQPLGEHLAERIFSPLGMRDTGFHVPPASLDRFARAYDLDEATQWIAPRDEPTERSFAHPPLFPSELVSTADDYLAFARMLLGSGRAPSGRLLSRASVALMMTDQITAQQRAASPFVPGFWETYGWGFGGGIVLGRSSHVSPGSYGWSGGFGTHVLIDPSEDLIVLTLTQRLLRGPGDDDLARKAAALAYGAIDD